MKVPLNEFDGKVSVALLTIIFSTAITANDFHQVVYGEKLKNSGTGYKDHVAQMTGVVSRLSDLESKAQTLFLKRFFY